MHERAPSPDIVGRRAELAARAGVDLYLGRSTHIGGDTIPLAPLADLLRQVRRSRPELLAESPTRVAEATHAGLVDDTESYKSSVQAIVDVIQSVRTEQPVTAR